MSLVLSVSLYMMKKTLIFPPCHEYQHYIKVQITAGKIPQHVHDGIHFYDCMWTVYVVANLCIFKVFFIMYNDTERTKDILVMFYIVIKSDIGRQNLSQDWITLFLLHARQLLCYVNKDNTFN
jgi:hypothetical protein